MNSEVSTITPITSNDGSFYRLKEGGQLVLFSSNGEYMVLVEHDSDGKLITKTVTLKDWRLK